MRKFKKLISVILSVCMMFSVIVAVPAEAAEKCFMCSGTGLCWYCYGAGYSWGSFCTICRGTGKCLTCDGSGLEGGSEKSLSKLGAPAWLKSDIKVKTTSITLKWTPVRGADAYRVYKYNSSTSKYEKLKNVSGATCSVKDLKKNTSYKFKVNSLVKSGNKYIEQTMSDIITIKTLNQDTFTAPKNIKTSSTSTSVTFSWDKVSGADAYRIYSPDTDLVTYRKYKDVTDTSITISGLKPGSIYYFKICTLADAGDFYAEQKMTSEFSINTTGSASTASYGGGSYSGGTDYSGGSTAGTRRCYACKIPGQCRVCNGTGQASYWLGSGAYKYHPSCSSCGGTGKCTACKGTGYF